MCLFSGPVLHVSSTRIYAAPAPGEDREGGRHLQRLAYAMTVELPDDVAMVLPIPTPPGSPEDAVTFVDLSSCSYFFDNLDLLFEPDVPAPQAFGAPSRAPALAKLVVHDVGDFEASFVPTLTDFARLDARFRLSDEVWSKLPQYADWGFAVFKLRPPKPEKPGKRGLLSCLPFVGDALAPAPAPPAVPVARHPMAFDFPRRDPTRLFFPTVHVHDGEVHAVAHFDHVLFAQLEGVPGATPVAPAASEPPDGWDRPARPAPPLLAPLHPFVHLDRPVFRRRIRGMQPNGDITL